MFSITGRNLQFQVTKTIVIFPNGFTIVNNIIVIKEIFSYRMIAEALQQEYKRNTNAKNIKKGDKRGMRSYFFSIIVLLSLVRLF